MDMDTENNSTYNTILFLRATGRIHIIFESQNVEIVLQSVIPYGPVRLQRFSQRMPTYEKLMHLK